MTDIFFPYLRAIWLMLSRFFLGWQNELATDPAFRRFPPGGADGQDIDPRAAGSGRGAVAYAEGLPGLRSPDAPALRQRPHPGDVGGPGAAAAEDPALRKGRLRAPSPSLPAGGGRRSGFAGARVRSGRDCLGGDGECQASCRVACVMIFVYAAPTFRVFDWLWSKAAWTTASRSGLSVTAVIGVQFRV